MADEFTGEPGYSATLWESDFAFRKPACDVVLQGCAYSPNGRPAERVRVGLRVGGWSKALDVVGDRTWQVAGPAIVSTKPRPFVRQTFGYDTAFGGVDRLDPEVEHPPAYMPNPVGTGWAQLRNQSRLSGLAFAQHPSCRRGSHFALWSLLPHGARPLRARLARPHRARRHLRPALAGPCLPLPALGLRRPLLPDGPARPADPPPPGPASRSSSSTSRPAAARPSGCPDCRLPITVFRRRETALERTVLPDTLLFDTEAHQLSLVWRIDTPIRRIITEFTHAWIGPPTEAMLRTRREGRRYVRAVGTR